MTIEDLINLNLYELIHAGADKSRTISTPYCCDLLSVAMSSAPENAIWFTVMANLNTLAVASLRSTACIVLAQNAALDEPVFQKAKEEGIAIFRTELPVFNAALLFHNSVFTDGPAHFHK